MRMSGLLRLLNIRLRNYDVTEHCASGVRTRDCERDARVGRVLDGCVDVRAKV